MGELGFQQHLLESQWERSVQVDRTWEKAYGQVSDEAIVCEPRMAQKSATLQDQTEFSNRLLELHSVCSEISRENRGHVDG